MFKELKARFGQGFRTISFPKGEPVLPERFRGLPVVKSIQCQEDCTICESVCPVEAISCSGLNTTSINLDLGRCVFCGLCARDCPSKAIEFTRDYKMAVRKREELILSDGRTLALATALKKEMLRVFGRSLQLRQVSAGGCNGCEVEVNVLNTVVFDLSRFGIQFVASPRHADGLLITGPVTQNMKLALQKTYDAVPEPKLMIVVGACAISGGYFRDHPEVCNGALGIAPVDLYIPGCPPHPLTTLDGLLRLLSNSQVKIAQ
jgi:Ni,Fe-hydrogenase III small subunit/NAD-dependent dihydropyrimidine dehydrogenase PreA subunit